MVSIFTCHEAGIILWHNLLATICFEYRSSSDALLFVIPYSLRVTKTQKKLHIKLHLQMSLHWLLLQKTLDFSFTGLYYPFSPMASWRMDYFLFLKFSALDTSVEYHKSDSWLIWHQWFVNPLHIHWGSCTYCKMVLLNFEIFSLSDEVKLSVGHKK